MSKEIFSDKPEYKQCTLDFLGRQIMRMPHEYRSAGRLGGRAGLADSGLSCSLALLWPRQQALVEFIRLLHQKKVAGASEYFQFCTRQARCQSMGCSERADGVAVTSHYQRRLLNIRQLV